MTASQLITEFFLSWPKTKGHLIVRGGDMERVFGDFEFYPNKKPRRHTGAFSKTKCVKYLHITSRTEHQFLEQRSLHPG